MTLKAKDYAFLKLLVEEDDHQLTTREMREKSEQNKNLVDLSNDEINYRIASLGNGNSNVSGKGFVREKKQKSYGSEPKTVILKEEREGEVKRILEEYNPSIDTSEFGSVQDAVNHLIEQIDELKDTSTTNAEDVEELQSAVEELNNTLKQLDELAETVEDNTDHLEVFDNEYKPLLIGMADKLHKEADFDFNPANYID